jgi:hypothetical protein
MSGRNKCISYHSISDINNTINLYQYIDNRDGNKQIGLKYISYNIGWRYSKKEENYKTDLIHDNQKIFVNQKDSFKVSFPNLFQKYQNPPLHTNGPWNTWIHSSFYWWQCQLNFAVWCASTGCGVSYNDHLKSEGASLISSVYLFHFYYCISRILPKPYA